MERSSAKHYMNTLGSEKKAFVFIIDFEMKKPLVYPIGEIPENISLVTPGFSHHNVITDIQKKPFGFNKFPVDIKLYKKAFNQVMAEIMYGNSFLLNLCFPTRIETELTLMDIFSRAESKYRLLIHDELVVFSPECFVRIEDGKIFSYPMKGTIDAAVDDAENIILNDEKELAEHFTIVDLIRNDLSMVGSDTWVRKFRFIERIKTNEKELLQVSSEIEATLPVDFHSRIGDLLFALLPAGSISGAPKVKTLEIIKDAEIQERGYYTGVCGVFDGENLDSFVMIRYIENTPEGLVFKSGCGITHLSDVDSEYRELTDKVYVPFG
jgi:para-aminobenzoate synthetase component 1